MIDYPQRPISHVIGNKAVQLVVAAFPSDWVCQEIGHDYGLDLRVEIVSNGKVTGEEFFVQVKGTGREGRTSESCTHVSVNHTTVNYWLTKLHPVLITRVDTERQCIWFDWLEHSYRDYPVTVSKKGKVSLVLRRSSASHAFADEVKVYVARYFERVRIDANSLTENRLVIKLLWTAFGLYRELEVINEKIQNVDIVADLINSVSYFYFMFCMYDESLTWRSEEQLRNRNWASPQTGSIITGSLERYAALSKWFRTGEKLSDIDGNAFYIPVGEFKEKCRELKEILGDLTHNLLGIMAEGSR